MVCRINEFRDTIQRQIWPTWADQGSRLDFHNHDFDMTTLLECFPTLHEWTTIKDFQIII